MISSAHPISSTSPPTISFPRLKRRKLPETPCLAQQLLCPTFKRAQWKDNPEQVVLPASQTAPFPDCGKTYSLYTEGMSGWNSKPHKKCIDCFQGPRVDLTISIDQRDYKEFGVRCPRLTRSSTKARQTQAPKPLYGSTTNLCPHDSLTTISSLCQWIWRQQIRLPSRLTVPCFSVYPAYPQQVRSFHVPRWCMPAVKPKVSTNLWSP